jgi:putative ABC transport system substrate-binding protein
VKRREFMALLGGAAVAWPRAAHAQQAGKVYRIGFIAATRTGGVMVKGFPPFLDELQKLGFSEGQNLVVDFRSSQQDMPRLIADVTELIRSKVDVIVTSGTEVVLQAVIAVSSTIPIVVWANNFDPIARGYVKSLAQPGGNVTGVFTRQLELAEKQVELLTQTFPDKTRLGLLWDDQTADQFGAAERRARAFGLERHAVKLESLPYDVDAAFRTLAERSPQMLLVLSGPLFAPYQRKIAELTRQYRLPTMFIFRTYVEAGGLVSYGVHIETSLRRVAVYVGKILNGAKPADLPVEQPTRFELVVNLKTAKAIGIELPTSLLLRADEVIE